MPNKTVPSYCLHKPSGQARVIIDGQHIYLGPFGSPQSREKYAKLLADRFASVTTTPGVAGPAHAMTGRYPIISINELILKYIQHAETYYVLDGQMTGSVANVKDAMPALRTLYGESRADEFGPKALKTIQRYLIEFQDLSRGVINSRVGQIKRMFKWAVSEELVPPGIYEGLRAVNGLRYGRSNARETQPVMPVSDAVIEQTLKFLPPQLADMVRLQRVTGMRSSNLVLMRPCEIDRSGTIWIYEPVQHKTRYRGKRLQILIGPQGQAILKPYLADRLPQAYIFSPVEVAVWREEHRGPHKRPRKTKIYPCELRRLEKERRARLRRIRRRPSGEHYDTNSFRRAIEYAIKAAKRAGTPIEHWFPHQLRHSRATDVRRQFGIEGAQLALGHSKANITEVYAERDLEFAKRIARKTG